MATVPPASKSDLPEVIPDWAGVSEVLCVGYGERSGAVITKGKAVMRARTTPSAGALYPFEVMVALRSRGGYEVYHYQVVGACLRHLTSVPEGDVASLIFPAETNSSPPVAIVILVGRAVRSMRKYGSRGYLYTNLDMGHAATNIAIAAEEAGYVSAVRLRFDRQRAAWLFGLEHEILEPHSLITLSHPERPRPSAQRMTNPFAVPLWRHDDDSALEVSDPDDREAWRAVGPVSGSVDEAGVTPRRGRVLSVDADGDDRPDGVRLRRPRAGSSFTFHRVALRRESAKGFVPEPVERDVLAHTLSALTEPTQVDCADGPVVGVRLLVRQVNGLERGVCVYSPAQHSLRPVRAGGCADDAVVAACMNQEVVRSAAVLVALHAPVRPLLNRFGKQGLAELLFHAACAAQRLCLGAAEHGIGITCVGGFDAELVGDLTGLRAPQETLYVLAAGVPDRFAVKWDRAPIAYSHGSPVTDRSGDVSAPERAVYP
ncbi:nitroreductase family protein [Actinophytocola sediminis]